MAETATLYQFTIDLADMDRNVYEALELRVARHPSETLEYMVVRVLAYCLEYQDGILLTEGVSSGDEPALLVKDLTGRTIAWIEVGLPEAARLHRASKAAGRVVVYPHRDTRQWLAQLTGARIHQREDIVVRTFDRAALDAMMAHLDRRTSLSLSITHGEVYASIGAQTFPLPLVEQRLPA